MLKCQMLNAQINQAAIKKRKKEKKSLLLQVGLRARMVYSSSSREVTWTSKCVGGGGGKVSVCARFAVRARFAESKALAQQLRPYFPLFLFLFGSIVENRATRKIAFYFFFFPPGCYYPNRIGTESFPH